MVSTAHLCLSDALKVTQLMRLSKTAYAGISGHTVAGFFNGVTWVAGFLLEVARHFAIIKYLADSDDVREVAVLPARLLGSELVLTNLNVMNVTFSTSMILTARAMWVTFANSGQRFVVLNTAINIKPQYMGDAT
jgi:hypothetical protein